MDLLENLLKARIWQKIFNLSADWSEVRSRDFRAVKLALCCVHCLHLSLGLPVDSRQPFALTILTLIISLFFIRHILKWTLVTSRLKYEICAAAFDFLAIEVLVSAAGWVRSTLSSSWTWPLFWCIGWQWGNVKPRWNGRMHPQQRAGNTNSVSEFTWFAATRPGNHHQC